MQLVRDVPPALIVTTGLAVSTIVISALGLFCGTLAAKSLALGCIVFALPTVYFTYYAFRFDAEQQTELMVRSFFKGQSNKLLLMAVCFSLVFVFVKPLNVPALFFGFGLMIAAHLVLASIISKSREASVEH